MNNVSGGCRSSAQYGRMWSSGRWGGTKFLHLHVQVIDTPAEGEKLIRGTQSVHRLSKLFLQSSTGRHRSRRSEAGGTAEVRIRRAHTESRQCRRMDRLCMHELIARTLQKAKSSSSGPVQKKTEAGKTQGNTRACSHSRGPKECNNRSSERREATILVP